MSGDDADDVLQQKQIARLLVEGLLDPDRVTGLRGPDAAHGIDFVHALAHAVTDADHPELARCVCATLLASVQGRDRLVQLVERASTEEGSAGSAGPVRDLASAQILRAHGVHALAIAAHLATSAAGARTTGRQYPGLDLALTLLERGVLFVARCWGLPLAECSVACRTDAQRFLVCGLCNLRHVAVAGGLSSPQRRMHAGALAALGRVLDGVGFGRQELCALLATAVHYVAPCDEQATDLRAVWAPVAADLLLTAHEHGDGPKVLWCVVQGLVGDADSASHIARGCAAFKASASMPYLDKCLAILGELEVVCWRFRPRTEYLCCWFKLKDLVCAVAWDFPGIVGEVRMRGRARVLGWLPRMGIALCGGMCMARVRLMPRP
jgi:hypothetical protein